ncbi:hypothetical protein ACFPM7_17215 [Actinokineospora guangxiensis]|uniref:DUF202 domain-containing protein n=1 Tax=Actinokineospora guangxiensis TaxID=1490288 RepID=A0ABW0ETF6_9PSEU
MTTRYGTGRRRFWEWTPAFALRLVVGNLAMIASVLVFRVSESRGVQWGMVALGIAGVIVVWLSWAGKKDNYRGEGGKIYMYGALDRIGYWGSVLITTAFVVAGGFLFPITLFDN